MYNISIHFDGPITEDHRVSVRTLATSLSHIQSAIDRAYLDIKYGNVWKHARLKSADYEQTEFIAMYPREGGFIMDMVKKGGETIVDRLNSAVSGAFNEALEQSENEHRQLIEQAKQRLSVYKASGNAKEFREVISNPDKRMIRAYGDRSIAKEIDQMLSLVRNKNVEGSTVELSLNGSKNHGVYTFDYQLAHSFHDVISEKNLGDPMILPITLRSLDSGNKYQSPKGKATNIETKRDFVLHIGSTEDFDKLVPYLQKRKKKEIVVIASPIVEYGAFDPHGGDMYFLDILDV